MLCVYAHNIGESDHHDNADSTYDVAVIGGGLVGCSAALALAHQRLKVVLLDAADWSQYLVASQDLPNGREKREDKKSASSPTPQIQQSSQPRRGDQRALTVSRGSEALYTKIGVWPLLSPTGTTPIKAIDIVDGMDPITHQTLSNPILKKLCQRSLPLVSMDADGLGFDRFGSIARHGDVLGGLRDAVVRHDLITVVSGCAVEDCGQSEHNAWVRTKPIALNAQNSNHSRESQSSASTSTSTSTSASAPLTKTWHMPLVVVVDGRNSTTRGLLGIGVREHHYHISAMIAVIQCEKDHNGIAFERFLPDGPFAVLPLPDRHAGIVWCAPTLTMQAWQSGKHEHILQGIKTRMGSYGAYLGDVSFDQSAGITVYPLQQRLARIMHRGRFAIIGDAAHVIHPIAGLGFNLGVRDAFALADAVGDALALGLDPATPSYIARWAKQRRRDVMALATVTHEVDRWMSTSQWGVRAARGIGMRAFNHTPTLQKLIVRGAMFGPLSLLSTLR